MDPLLERLHADREELARRWLLRLVAEDPLEQVAELPTERIARELPDLISELLRIAEQEPGLTPEDAHRSHQRLVVALAGLTRREGADPARAARGLAALQSVILHALTSDVADPRARAVLEAIERLARSFGAVLAASEALVARAGEPSRPDAIDRLTGLPDERHLRRQLEHLTALHQRYDVPFVLLVLDVDGLRRINDAFGRAAGDRALVAVAEIVRGTLRSVDIAGRRGDDEFYVLAPHQVPSGARVIARRLTEAVGRADALEGGALRVSIGAAACPGDGVEPNELLERADEAVYRAKASGLGLAVAADVAPGRETS